MKRRIVSILCIALCALILVVFGTYGAEKKSGGNVVRGTVQDVSGQMIEKAAVYLIPADDVAAMAKTPLQVGRNSANDEPLEDSLAANIDKYKKASTDKKGNFTISGVAEGKYFIYVAPSEKTYLPGGDKSNKAISTTELKGKTIKILLSGNTPDNAVYVGTSQCLTCHAAYKAQKKTLHGLGIKVVGKQSKLQDYSRFPNFDDGLNKLMAGRKLYFSGFDKGRGFDKYLISEKMPADAASVSFAATFFKDTDGKLKFRTENMKDPSDPARTYTVEMTYGGGLYKQRYLYRSGQYLFPFVQFNTMGDESYADRARKTWRDYHADWLFNEGTKKLADPPKKKSFEIDCASCHFTGYSLTPTVAGDFVAGAVNDPNGEADIDGDGIPNELNIGCEVCHGPGSEHAKSPKAKKASTIVSPRKLPPERASVICEQCHTRPQGNLKNDQPVSKDNKMMLPGTGRNEFLVNFTTREDAAQRDFWPDKLHSKSHHQQGTDFIKSKKYRNGTHIMICTDCHDPHGIKEVKHQLRAEVRDAKNTLCTSCHKGMADVTTHTAAKVGMGHTDIHCVDCHNAKTMQTGAGFGKGLTRKDGKNYWMNDITSHIFDVPRKDNVTVKGVDPAKAMPIPYTNACGKCHNADGL
ncbi:MAG TPA: cytochrome c3 family protein [Candidatus Binatia bacterium]|nr:cytochrome c3 family protein [Candidatus Binatia bacterium]